MAYYTSPPSLLICFFTACRCPRGGAPPLRHLHQRASPPPTSRSASTGCSRSTCSSRSPCWSATPGSCWWALQGGAARRRSTRPRRARACETKKKFFFFFFFCLAMNTHRSLHALHPRDCGAELPRPADRPRDDRRLDPLPVARGPRHGHRRRAAAERHVHELHPACGAALHPLGRDHELGQHDRPAPPLLRRAPSAASAAASPRSTSCSR